MKKSNLVYYDILYSEINFLELKLVLGRPNLTQLSLLQAGPVG